MGHVVETDIAHAEGMDQQEPGKAEHVAIEAHGIGEVAHMDMDVTDARAGGHAGGFDGRRAQFGEEAAEIDGLTAGMGAPFGGDGVGLALVRIAQRAAPGGLEGDLDAIAVEIPEIDGLGDEVIGGRDADIAPQGTEGHLREIDPTRHMDGHVVEADGARHDRAGGAGFEHDQRAAAGAEGEEIAGLGDEIETHDLLPDGERAGTIGDGEMDGAERRGQRQEGRRFDIGLNGSVDHLSILC